MSVHASPFTIRATCSAHLILCKALLYIKRFKTTYFVTLFIEWRQILQIKAYGSCKHEKI
jgi:hypothetical protein